jgi:hypothetical protein
MGIAINDVRVGNFRSLANIEVALGDGVGPAAIS